MKDFSPLQISDYIKNFIFIGVLVIFKRKFNFYIKNIFI